MAFQFFSQKPILSSFFQYVDDTRTNWAELNELNELWKLCDEVSQLHRGIPDSLLKVALLNVLERHQRTLSTHWMRQHVDNLIRSQRRFTIINGVLVILFGAGVEAFFFFQDFIFPTILFRSICLHNYEAFIIQRWSHV